MCHSSVPFHPSWLGVSSFWTPRSISLTFFFIFVTGVVKSEPSTLPGITRPLNSGLQWFTKGGHLFIILSIRAFHIDDAWYIKLYDASFKSHISYCISSWGGISSTKLESLFVIQKRCIRLLFGKIINFDHPEFYQTCARARQYQQNPAKKNYALEHTKPIFNEMGLLSLHHLHIYHTFLDMYKILKLKTPLTLHKLFELSHTPMNMITILPKIQISRGSSKSIGHLWWWVG